MIKHTSKQLDLVIDTIGRVKAFADNLSAIQSPDKETFWKALKAVIEKSKKGHLDRIMDTLAQKDLISPESTLNEVKFIRGCVAAYDEVIGVVERNQQACDEASARLKELKDSAENIKNNIDLQ